MFKKFRLLYVFLLVSVMIPVVQSSPIDRAGPIITLHSDVYQAGNKWYCPLCRQPVENGDRTKIPTKLCLSEWPDVFIDSSYLDNVELACYLGLIEKQAVCFIAADQPQYS